MNHLDLFMKHSGQCFEVPMQKVRITFQIIAFLTIGLPIVLSKSWGRFNYN